jgi:hypothetical protein
MLDEVIEFNSMNVILQTSLWPRSLFRLYQNLVQEDKSEGDSGGRGYNEVGEGG